jgi:hypothetical protein
MKNMEKDRDERTHDLYGEKDIPESKILDIEIYMDKNAKKIVDYIEQLIAENSQKNLKISGEIPDAIMNEVTNEMPFGSVGVPFGPAFDATHIILTDSLVSSLWCGWLSQSMVNRNESKFDRQYVEQFKRAIKKAYEIGQKYANTQKSSQ